MKILIPSKAPASYRLAGEAFQRMYEAVTGVRPSIVYEDDGGDLVVIGGGDVNAFARRAMLDGWGLAEDVPIGGDGYAMSSARRDGRDVLFLYGGRGRSTLYAVYAFFERRAGCRYFWDGDVIPRLKRVKIDGLKERRIPDFALRGIRYFAHRGLHRFQAEHWGLEDWKREIDWLIKRGLNLFMLRVGADDVFQKAFPDIVDYPAAEGELAEAGDGYDARTLFWPLQYRGWLRRQVFDYAFERDLLEPEDCGAITHWYSRTPLQFLQKVRPGFMPQVTDVYRQPTGLVWDIREDANLDRYVELTKAHIRAYGQARLFHTIGLAERMCSDDRGQNLRYKKMAYQRILGRVEQEWPGSPVLIASWDFAMHWRPDEVRDLLKTLNPDRHVIFDYTADTRDPVNNFEHWGVSQAFPWIFGIFHAFEPNSDLRGDYDQLTKRLAMARGDPMCRGLVFWPELSHSDTLMLEFFAKSAWSAVDPAMFLRRFCQDRYGGQAQAMLKAWRALWPLLPLRVWELDREAAIEDIHQEYFFDALGYGALRSWPAEKMAAWKKTAAGLTGVTAQSAETLRKVAAAYGGDEPGDAFVRRDCVDLARTALGRALNAALIGMICAASQGRWLERAAHAYRELLLCLCGVLDSHEDYSQLRTLEGLRKEHTVNDAFEPAFKQNVVNGYCRGYAAEFLRWLCAPENDAYLEWLKEAAMTGSRPDGAALLAKKEALFKGYMARPLESMAPQKPDHLRDVLLAGAKALDVLGRQAWEAKEEAL